MSLKGKCFCITGKFWVPHKQLEKLLKSAGATVASSVTHRVTHLLAQNDEGSEKWATAKGKGLPILDEVAIRKLLDKASPKKKRAKSESEDEAPPLKKAKTAKKATMSKLELVDTLCKAAFEGNISLVKSTLAKDLSILDEKNERGQTALYCAARNGHGAVAKCLLDLGADASIQESNGSTPLHAAAFFGHLVTVESMAKGGADLKILNRHGLTALNEAKSPEIKAFLTEYAMTDAESLCDAAFKGDTTRVKKILARDSSLVNSMNDRNQTALYCAARNGHCPAAKALLAKSADLSIADSHGSTPLHAASYFGHADMVRLLLEKGADKERRNNFNMTAEEEALAQGKKDVLDVFNPEEEGEEAEKEEGKEVAVTTGSVTTTVTITAVEMGEKKTEDEAVESTEEGKTTTETPLLPVISLKRSSTAIDSSKSCILCVDSPGVMAVYPCGHRCLCPVCADSVFEERDDGKVTCPKCKAVGTDIIHVYQ